MTEPAISNALSMQLKKAFLVLVDISGYTQFIRLHKASLIHAEKIISEFLESIIQCSEPPLVLNKLEGDAALFYAEDDGTQESAKKVLQLVVRFLEKIDVFSENRSVYHPAISGNEVAHLP